MNKQIQRIILVRHGYSAGNHNGDSYKKYGDAHVPLHEKGWRQAIAAGKFLRAFYEQNPPLYDNGPLIRMSPFQRVKETFAGAAHGADGFFDNYKMAVDPMLSEQDFGLFSHLHNLEDRRVQMPLYAEFTERTRKQSKFFSRLPLGESPFDVYTRITHFYESVHRDLQKHGVNDILVFAHGRTNQMLAMRLLKLPPESLPDLKTPGNCDVWKMERNIKYDGKFGLEKIYDGELMQPAAIDLKALLDAKHPPLTVKTLPPVPKAFR